VRALGAPLVLVREHGRDLCHELGCSVPTPSTRPGPMMQGSQVTSSESVFKRPDISHSLSRIRESPCHDVMPGPPTVI
jgi:hypothetical protein